tara:strand:+ start:3176 stop:3622 length:447 start_codon:yes stop_codon:yes gene_type:complete
MPTYIVKATPDEDWYCMWSTVVDAPTYWGTRRELEQAARDPREIAAERFHRADDNGSSAAWPGWPAARQPFAWADDEFLLMNDTPPMPDPLPDGADGACWLLPRANLRAFCEALDQPDGDLAPLLRLNLYDADGNEIESFGPESGDAR